MREQCPGGIELLAVEDKSVALGGDPRFDIQGVFGAAFRPGIADAPAIQHALKQLLLLCRVRTAQQRMENADLVLRDLPQRGVGGGNDLEHLRQGHE